MKRFTVCFIAVALCLVFGIAWAARDSNKFIEQLGDKDPSVRAKAAYELGCG
jgi:hypothetical protein